MLFDMTFRSFSVLYPWSDWASDLEMRRLPLRFASHEERQRMARRATPTNPTPVRDDDLEALQSLVEYLRPWPNAETARHLDSPTAWGKYTLTWLASRLGLFEDLVGFNNEWPMFSPNVSRRKTLTRARLFYVDGSERIVRIHGDPVNLNSYFHWNEEKVLDHELKVCDDSGYEDECFAWCNLLSHRYARNSSDSPLVKVRLFQVRYRLPPPGVDYRAWYNEQMRLTPDHVPSEPPGPDEDTQWQTEPDYYEWSAVARKGRRLKD
jgi:hypothetical protein